MKKILKQGGAQSKNKTDYIQMFRDASPGAVKKSSLADLRKRIEEARAEKLKKAS